MSDLDTRLVECFRAVFPALASEAEIRSASAQDMEAWDSVALVTLVSVVEEAFELEIDFDEAEGLTSFQAIRDYLLGATAG